MPIRRCDKVDQDRQLPGTFAEPDPIARARRSKRPDRPAEPTRWLRRRTLPNPGCRRKREWAYPYTAREIADGRSGVGPATDVYGLGSLLYEMLAGKPAYEYHLRKDQTVLKDVMGGEFKPSGRIDLKNIPEIAEKSINRIYDQRFPDVLAFVNALQPNFPPLPAERKSFQVNWRVVFIVLGALLAISLLLVMALSIVLDKWGDDLCLTTFS